jgi:hypothetical protein
MISSGQAARGGGRLERRRTLGINWASWLRSGLLAGLVISLSGSLLAHNVLGPGYVAAFRSHMVDPLPVGPTIALNLAIRFGFGLLGMFLYVAFRPRFGPGPATAALAGLALAVGTYLPHLLLLGQFGILTGSQALLAGAWGVAEAVLACVAGAWAYRERPGP